MTEESVSVKDLIEDLESLFVYRIPQSSKEPKTLSLQLVVPLTPLTQAPLTQVFLLRKNVIKQRFHMLNSFHVSKVCYPKKKEKITTM